MGKIGHEPAVVVCKEAAPLAELELGTFYVKTKGEDRAVHMKAGDTYSLRFSPAGGDIIVRAFLRGLDDVLELKPRPLREVAAAPAGNAPLQ